jgi:hypothetical protein
MSPPPGGVERSDARLEVADLLSRQQLATPVADFDRTRASAHPVGRSGAGTA